LLTAYYPFRRRDGEVMALLMVCYAVHRFLNELLRADPRPVGFERYASVILFACGVGLYLWLLRKPVQYRAQMPVLVGVENKSPPRAPLPAGQKVRGRRAQG